MASATVDSICNQNLRTYIVNPDSKKHVYISHGSAGLGPTEELVAKELLNSGINVSLIDYFSKNNIKKLFWLDRDHLNDKHAVSLKDIIDVELPYGEVKFHIGFSLGGYIGLANNQQFQKNYCFYPGCLPLPTYLNQADYSNTKIFIGANDNWCLEGVEYFVARARGDIEVTYLPGCFHSFMSPDKLLQTEVIKYQITEQFVSNIVLSKIKFDTKILKEMFAWERIKVTLQSNPIAAEQCLHKIIQDIAEY